MVNNKNIRSPVGRSTHCTSFGVCDNVQLPNYNVPSDLHGALQNYHIRQHTHTELCKSYIDIIESLPNIKKIKANHYLVLFKILLYLEDHSIQLLATKHNLRNVNVTRVSNTFVITVPTLNEDDSIIRVGDKVLLKYTVKKDCAKNPKRFVYCRIMEITKQKVYLSPFNESFLTKFDTGNNVDVHFFAANWSLRCCHYVLHIMFKYNLVDLIYPKIDTNFRTLPKSDLDWIHKSVIENPEQKTAVCNILNNSAQPAPYIIFGPPGTGKTTTLIEAVCQIRKQYRSKNILICASSNAAADEIAKRLLHLLPHKDVFRMYAPSQHWKYIDEKINPSSNFVDEKVIYLPKEIFILKKIVITTLVTCISQSTELESLIPLAIVNSKNEIGEKLHAQIVIAGDPHQLGPIVRCTKIKHLFGKSLLERLMECEPYQKVNNKYNSRYITKLIRNYRSEKAILYASNKLFYDGELLCCKKSDTGCITSKWKLLSNRTFPIIFFEVIGHEIRAPNMSVYNEKEIAIITEWIKKLMSSKIGNRKIQQNDIGVVTPFKKQKVMIEESLSKHKLNKITVGTVETFQGQEREIMFVSTVRSKVFKDNDKEHIGFLSHPRRFNVAITRAKSLLIIVGNPSVLCKDKHWNTLWKYCKANNACNTEPM
ncbi:unnamed protein product [Xylocopa violacea]|uniref:RNA helicase n=1 Tax=Xylocopa violacea TaxID=135666 RepID=A0ABP1PFI8_XYLVO